MFVDNVDVPGFSKFLTGSELMNPEASLPLETNGQRVQGKQLPVIGYLLPPTLWNRLTPFFDVF